MTVKTLLNFKDCLVPAQRRAWRTYMRKENVKKAAALWPGYRSMVCEGSSGTVGQRHQRCIGFPVCSCDCHDTPTGPTERDATEFRVDREKRALADIEFRAVNAPELEAWIKKYQVKREGRYLIVYKAVDMNYVSRHNFQYTLKSRVAAPDWEWSTVCRGGLFFGPDPSCAVNYASSHLTCLTRMLQCRIPVDRAIPIGDKIKASRCIVDSEINPEDRFSWRAVHLGSFLPILT